MRELDAIMLICSELELSESIAWQVVELYRRYRKLAKPLPQSAIMFWCVLAVCRSRGYGIRFNDVYAAVKAIRPRLGRRVLDNAYFAMQERGFAVRRSKPATNKTATSTQRPTSLSVQ